MSFWRNVPLKYRLLLLTLISSGIGLIVALAAFLTYQERTIREHKLEEMDSAADLIGSNSTAALIFDDAEEGHRVLRALASRKNIHVGALYRRDGSLFACYLRTKGLKFAGHGEHVNSDQVEWTNDHLSFYRPVVFEERTIGSLYVEADLEDLRGQIAGNSTFQFNASVDSWLYSFAPEVHYRFHKALSWNCPGSG